MAIPRDFSIQIATVNGSGSQTANYVLLQTLFQLGLPVSSKNDFPSNIAGLPTWFTIRISPSGFLARQDHAALLVALNPETAEEDLAQAAPGSWMLWDEALGSPTSRPEITLFMVPYQALVAEADPKLHKLLKNMVYVGVLAHLIGLPIEHVQAELAEQLSGKTRALELNLDTLQRAYTYAREHFAPIPELGVIPPEPNPERLLMDGNTACALGALFAGVTVAAWYPITPSTSFFEALQKYGERIRKYEGQSTLAILQTEDELAAAGVVVGAGWTGARAMTATSGPGISLMSEFIGLAYWAEIPAVFMDVQRVGPSTGLPTRSGQQDIETCARASHGDTLHICLYPADPAECFQFTYQAFDLAERFQTPVFVVSDLDLGMQKWTTPRFACPEAPLDRGKVLRQEELAKLPDFARYRDLDGDGIPYRSLPGTPGGKGAYFTRGTGHTPKATYSEKGSDLITKLDRLKQKFQTAGSAVPEPILQSISSEDGLIAFGSTHAAVVEALDILKKKGLPLDYLRLRALPFTPTVLDFVAHKRRIFVAEQNRDGQMAMLLKEACPEHAHKFISILNYDGIGFRASRIARIIQEQGS